MKITVDVDCTPEEARTFFGLPDVAPLQDAVLKEIQAQMKKNIQTMDVERFVGMIFPKGMEGLEQLQKMFWNAAGNMTGTGKK